MVAAMSDLTYPNGRLRSLQERALQRWADSPQGEVLRLAPLRAQIDVDSRSVRMRFAWTGEDGLPPVDSYGSMVYPSAFAHIADGVPLVRNHEWSDLIGHGRVRVSEREALIEGRLAATERGNRAAQEMAMLRDGGVPLECSVSMRPSTARTRNGSELSVEEQAALEAAGWGQWGYAIDYAEIIEVSWVLAGAVPSTSVELRGEEAEERSEAREEPADSADSADSDRLNDRRGELALWVAISDAMEVLR